MLIINDNLRIPLREFHFTFVRSSGPGGQNVNKVSSKAVLRWNVTESSHVPEEVRQRFLRHFRRRLTKDGELLITSDRFRDQGRNIADCLAKLRNMLASVAEKQKPRRNTRPTRTSVYRRLTEKHIRSRRKAFRRPPAGEE
jgi:ribosome-associated protein